MFWKAFNVMSNLIVANKIFKDVSIVNKQRNRITLRMLTKDSNYFKHDIKNANKDDPVMYEAFKRSCACTLFVNTESFSNCVAVNIRKSRLTGYRIVTFERLS